MKFQTLDQARDYSVQLFVYRQTKVGRNVQSRRTGYCSRKPRSLTSSLLIAMLLSLTAAVILTSCTLPTGNAPIASQDEYGILIASPTPTFVLPGPDDEDPRMDCVLDAPACIIGTGIESIDGTAYIGASIAIDRGQLEDFKGSDEELVLDAKVAISNEGMHAGDIEVQDHTIAVASPDVDLVLASPDGDPMVNVITTIDGYLFYCNRNLFPRCPQQSPLFSFDPAAEGILIHNYEGIPIGEIGYDFPYYFPDDLFDHDPNYDWAFWGWNFGNDTDDEWPNWGDDSWPNWGYAFSLADIENSDIVLSDPAGNPVVTLAPRDGALFVFEPNGLPFATIGPNKNGSNQPVLNFIDSEDSPGASLSVREGGIFIDMGLGGAPVALIGPNYSEVGKVEEGESIILTMYFPVTDWVLKEVDLTGTVDLYTKDATGQRTVVSKVPVEIVIDDFSQYMKVEEGEPGKSPTATPAEILSKDTTASTKESSKSEPAPEKSDDKSDDKAAPAPSK